MTRITHLAGLHELILGMLLLLAHVADCSTKENHGGKEEGAEVGSMSAGSGMRRMKVVVDEEEVNFSKHCLSISSCCILIDNIFMFLPKSSLQESLMT